MDDSEYDDEAYVGEDSMYMGAIMEGGGGGKTLGSVDENSGMLDDHIVSSKRRTSGLYKQTRHEMLKSLRVSIGHLPDNNEEAMGLTNVDVEDIDTPPPPPRRSHLRASAALQLANMTIPDMPNSAGQRRPSDVNPPQLYRTSMQAIEERFGEDFCSKINSKRMLNILIGIVGACLLAGAILVTVRRTKPEESSYGMNNVRNDRLTCRIILEDIMYPDPENPKEFISGEEAMCLPIVDGKQRPFSFTVNLPADIAARHAEMIEEGTLFVSIYHATTHRDGDHVELTEDSQFHVLEGSPIRDRGLAKPATEAFGDRKLFFVRVCASNLCPRYSVQQIEDRLFNLPNCLKKQYEACSMEQMTWVNNGHLDITLPETIEHYHSGAGVRNAAIGKLFDDGHFTSELEELGDNIMFIVPATPRPFVANAGTASSVSTYSDGWAVDLRAVSHELGHNLGLSHSGFGTNAYGDHSGYMASTGGGEVSDGPGRCFNGFHSNQLQWYKERTLSFDPTSTGPKKVYLASFVDYRLAHEDQPVLLEVEAQYYLMYNQAKGINAGTGLHGDEVTIVEPGSGRTNLLGGVSLGNPIETTYQGQRLVFEVCETVTGTGIVGGPDGVIFAVGVGSSACNEELYSTGPAPTPPTPPTPSPTKSPTQAVGESSSGERSSGSGSGTTTEEIVHINCGSNVPVTIDGVDWTADQGYSGGSPAGFLDKDVLNRDGAAEFLFQTERWSSSTLTYQYNVAAHVSQAESFTVRLLFAEMYFEQAPGRIFDVDVNGHTIQNFDMIAEQGVRMAITKEFTVQPSQLVNSNILIQLIPRQSNPQIAGVEIFVNKGTGTTTTGGTSQQEVIRINCGSSSPVQIDGVLWSADQGATGGSPASFADQVVHGIASPNMAVLYQTERWSRGSLKYIYDVSAFTSAVSFVVKLHFSELYFSQPPGRIFNIDVNGKTIANFDVLAEVGPDTAIVKEFTVPKTSLQNGSIVVILNAIQSNPQVAAIEILANMAT